MTTEQTRETSAVMSNEELEAKIARLDDWNPPPQWPADVAAAPTLNAALDNAPEQAAKEPPPTTPVNENVRENTNINTNTEAQPAQTVTVDEASIKDTTKIHPLLDHEIPDQLHKRYAITDNLYFSKDSKKGLAFADRGKTIATHNFDADDINSMVELAKAKNWTKIKISGTEEFKKEAWLAASLQGLEVEGYKPSTQDIALLEDAKRRTQNKIEFAEPTLNPDKLSEKSSDRTQDKTQAQKEVEIAADKATLDQSIKFKYKPTAAEVAIIEVAKAKGASSKTQSMMKQKLQVAVSQLKAMGIEIPKPKLYDVKGKSIGDKTATVEIDSPVVQKNITQPQVAPRR
jgi:hypothetical protein